VEFCGEENRYWTSARTVKVVIKVLIQSTISGDFGKRSNKVAGNARTSTGRIKVNPLGKS
jgi:hypothetical protein